MAKKMCPNFGKWRNCHAFSIGEPTIKCPPGANENCEIIPKRKSKVRRVKAWAFVFMGKTGRVQIDAYSDRNISHKGLSPCTILIDEKYLKEKGNEK